jgi:hypothetical protein
MAEDAPIASRLRSGKQVRETRGRSLRKQKPYQRPARKPTQRPALSSYRDVDSKDREFLNDEGVATAKRVIRDIKDRVLVLDNEGFRTTRKLIAGGIPASQITIVEKADDVFARLQSIQRADPELKEVQLIHGNVFDEIRPTYKLLFLDFTGYCPSEDEMRVVKTSWLDRMPKECPHAIIFNISSRCNWPGPAIYRTVAFRMNWIQEQLPSMHCVWQYGYKSSTQQSMFPVKFASWSEGETEYRPHDVVGVCSDGGAKLYRVKWWGFTDPRDETMEPEDSAAVRILKDEGKI